MNGSDTSVSLVRDSDEHIDDVGDVNDVDPVLKRALIQSRVRRIIQESSTGVTTDTLREETGFSDDQIANAISVLLDRRMISVDWETETYHSGIDRLPTYGTREIHDGNRIIECMLVISPSERYYVRCIEKTIADESHTEYIESAILVPIDHLDEYLSILDKFEKELRENQRTFN